MVSILWKGVAEVECIEACSAGQRPEKVAWDQASGVSVGRVELLNAFLM